MRLNVQAALVLLATTSVFAFVPLQLTSRWARKQPLAHSSDLHEFDEWLTEGISRTSELPHGGSRRRIALTDFESTRQTILASEFAAAPRSIQQQEESTQEITGEEDPYGEDLGLQKIQQFQEATKPTIEQRLKQMDLQDIIATLILPSIVMFAAGRWVYNRVSTRVETKVDSLLDSFANELLYHDGDFNEMKLCIQDYSKRLVFLPQRNSSMLKRYLSQYAKKKTVSPQAISSLSYVLTQFKLSEEQAAQLLVSLCRQLGTDKISSAGKLLFLGRRILKSPEGQEALMPIKEMIMSTYREQTVAESLVDTSQQAMAEAAYRTVVQQGGKNQKQLTIGWEVLGLDKDAAQRIFDEEAKEGFVSAREAMYGRQTQKYDKKGRRIDKEGELENPEEADDDDGDDDEEELAVSNVYECGDCGYTLFVAQGRESKFFGSGFRCPECGAPKKKFKARDDMEVDD